MADGPDGSALDAAPEDAFALLGNEIRMATLRHLWEAYDPFAETNGLAFSELYDRVGAADSGQFNYHLDKLRGRYVEQIEDRYRLTPVGLRLVQAVIAGAGQRVDYEPSVVDADCRLCGAPIRIEYDGSRVFFVCTECDGNFDEPAYPDGTLWGTTMPPAGVGDRTPEELFATISFLDGPQKAFLTGNVCPECTGVLEQTIELCPDHDPAEDGPCPACGYVDPLRVEWVCTVCKYHAEGTPSGFVKNHPAVIAFRYEHGIDFGYPYTNADFETTQENESVRREMAYEVSIRSEDPLRVLVTVAYDGDAIELELDDELEVRSVHRSETA